MSSGDASSWRRRVIESRSGTQSHSPSRRPQGSPSKRLRTEESKTARSPLRNKSGRERISNAKSREDLHLVPCGIDFKGLLEQSKRETCLVVLARLFVACGRLLLVCFCAVLLASLWTLYAFLPPCMRHYGVTGVFRLLLVGFGVRKVVVKGLPDETVPALFDCRNYVVVSTHTNGHIDAFVLLSILGPHCCLVCDKEVESVPILGGFFKTLGFIFAKNRSRRGTAGRIAERVASMKRSINRTPANGTFHSWRHLCTPENMEFDHFRPVVVFPEGNTNDGTALLRFRTGAFAATGRLADPRIRPVHVSYGCASGRFCAPGGVLKDGHLRCRYLWGVMGMLHPGVVATVSFQDTYIPSEEEQCQPHLFADNVRSRMASLCKLRLSTYSGRYRVLDLGEARRGPFGCMSKLLPGPGTYARRRLAAVGEEVVFRIEVEQLRRDFEDSWACVVSWNRPCPDEAFADWLSESLTAVSHGDGKDGRQLEWIRGIGAQDWGCCDTALSINHIQPRSVSKAIERSLLNDFPRPNPAENFEGSLRKYCDDCVELAKKAGDLPEQIRAVRDAAAAVLSQTNPIETSNNIRAHLLPLLKGLLADSVQSMAEEGIRLVTQAKGRHRDMLDSVYNRSCVGACVLTRAETLALESDEQFEYSLRSSMPGKPCLVKYTISLEAECRLREHCKDVARSNRRSELLEGDAARQYNFDVAIFCWLHRIYTVAGLSRVESRRGNGEISDTIRSVATNLNIPCELMEMVLASSR